MDSTTNPAHVLLPVHEFPDGPVLLGDWRTTYRSATLGQMLLGRAGTMAETVVFRMHHLHLSRSRWYSTKVPLDHASSGLGTFELASGSHWDGPPGAVNDTDIDVPLEFVGIPMQHEHHYMIAEVSMTAPHPDRTPSPASSLESATTLGYLCIEGTCRSNVLLSRQNSPQRSIPPPSRLSSGTLNIYASLDTDSTARVLEGSSLLPYQIPIPQARNPPIPSSDLFIPSFDDEATPVARRQRESATEGTPTRGRPFNATKMTTFASDPPSQAQEPDIVDSGSDPNATAISGCLDKRPSSSPLFISPFASRSNSVSPSRSSTGTSQHTRPNSRSNSSNSTSFTTSSSFSLSSAGIVFSDNPLARGSIQFGDDARFVVTYLGPHITGFPTVQCPNECVVELSFPVEQGSPPVPSSSIYEAEAGPRSFLTLRDLSILADIVEHSLLKTKGRADQGLDSSSEFETAGSTSSNAGLEPSEISIPTPSVLPAYCGEFYKRLFALIPLVSGLRVGGGDDATLSGEEATTTPFEDKDESQDTTLAIAQHLKLVFERKRARFDKELLSAAKSVSVNRSAPSPHLSGYVSNENPWQTRDQDEPSSSPLWGGGPITRNERALEEARNATETFWNAVREAKDVVQSSDEEVEYDI